MDVRTRFQSGMARLDTVDQPEPAMMYTKWSLTNTSSHGFPGLARALVIVDLERHEITQYRTLCKVRYLTKSWWWSTLPDQSSLISVTWLPSFRVTAKAFGFSLKRTVNASSSFSIPPPTYYLSQAIAFTTAARVIWEQPPLVGQLREQDNGPTSSSIHASRPADDAPRANPTVSSRISRQKSPCR